MAYDLPSGIHNPITGGTAPATWGDAVNACFDVLNSETLILPVQAGQPPLSGITAAALELIESTGAGTAKPVIYRLRFDKDTDEGRMWVSRVPNQYGGTPVLVGSYHMNAANTTDDVVLVAQVACVSDGDITHDEKVFDSANSATITVPDAAETSDEFSITLTNDDSMTADDWLCIVLYRDANAAGDTATGDFCLTSLGLQYTLSA